MNKNIALISVAVPVDGLFDYAIQPQQKPAIELGMRVRVLFNGRKMAGYVVGFKDKSEFEKLNPVLELLENRPSFSPEALRWTREISDYYGCSWAEIMELCLAPVIKKGKKLTQLLPFGKCPTKPKSTSTLLVDLFYDQYMSELIDALKKTIAEDLSVVIIVPDKNQVESVVNTMSGLLSVPIVKVEKRVRVEKALKIHQDIIQDRACVIVGTRSAVFTLNPRVGLFVLLSEEHDAYKEEQSPYYNVSKVMGIRAQVEHSSQLYISANPTIELLDRAKKGKWKIQELQGSDQVNVQMVDMNNYNPRKSSILSFPLQNTIQKALQENKKILLYFNRKGFNTFTQCNQCGNTLTCQRCETILSYMFTSQKLKCRKCNYTEELPKICPQCKGSYLRSMGMGIEKLESEVNRYYPQAKAKIFDKDTKRIPASADLVLCTSAIFNLQSQYKADIGAILNYDNELNRSDFRSSHKALSVLSGLRRMVKEKLVIQTRLPDDVTIKAVRSMNFNEFIKSEKQLREELELPPYVRLMSIILRGEEEEKVLEVATRLFDKFQLAAYEGIEILDPFPDINPKLRNKYRYTIMLKADSSICLVKSVKETLKNFRKSKGVIITMNVDP